MQTLEAAQATWQAEVRSVWGAPLAQEWCQLALQTQDMQAYQRTVMHHTTNIRSSQEDIRKVGCRVSGFRVW